LSSDDKGPLVVKKTLKNFSKFSKNFQNFFGFGKFFKKNFRKNFKKISEKIFKIKKKFPTKRKFHLNIMLVILECVEDG